MFRDPCETRVFGDPCVEGEGGRLVCYGNRVLLARSCVQRVRGHVVTVCSDFIGCMGGVPSSRVSEFRAAEVIKAQCTDGPLNDMGRCSNRHVIRGDGGVGWVERCRYLAWEIGTWLSIRDRADRRRRHITQSTNNHVID